jgi:hypothetical protein
MCFIVTVLQLCSTICSYDDPSAPIGTEIECDDWLLVKACDDKLLGKIMDNTNKMTVAILVASKKSGPEVSTEKTKQH